MEIIKQPNDENSNKFENSNVNVSASFIKENCKNFELNEIANKSGFSQSREKSENFKYAQEEKNINSIKSFIANDRKGRSIHSKFLFLKKQLNLAHFMRKTQIDSLLKKCKSKAFKNIHEALKKCLKSKLGRLPQHFITNIKIDYNKYYLNRTILEIYQEFDIIKSYEDLVAKGHVVESRKKIFQDFLNMTFKQVYDFYINSHQFKKDYLNVSQREGQNFAILFSYIAQIFIQYYQKSRGNKKKNSGLNSGYQHNSRSSCEEDSENEYDEQDEDNENISNLNNEGSRKDLKREN